jgi:hypothetical protein
MGYVVTLEGSNAVIPTDKLDEAYKILCDLNNYNRLKRGGNGHSFDEEWRAANEFGANENVWFSWMDWNYPETCADTAAVIEQLGFGFSLESDGLHFLYYDNKTGSEDVFIAALGPVLTSTDNTHPFFLWRGEDGEVWRQVAIDGEVIAQAGRLTFEAV